MFGKKKEKKKHSGLKVAIIVIVLLLAIWLVPNLIFKALYSTSNSSESHPKGYFYGMELCQDLVERPAHFVFNKDNYTYKNGEGETEKGTFEVNGDEIVFTPKTGTPYTSDYSYLEQDDDFAGVTIDKDFYEQAHGFWEVKFANTFIDLIF